ncbi:MAG TPA: hypothetical protein VMB51_01090 [Solirubrobacteraceae bacterium]|nr:hypothetical protein [Solirubrobacteraceae bacterium]
MSDDKQEGLSRSEVFAALSARGADRAVVEFSGGNDEGGPDAITLFAGEETVATLRLWPGASQSDAERAEIELSDALSAPIFERYGSFDGDFDVYGELIWSVAGQTVKLICDERAEYEHSEVQL